MMLSSSTYAWFTMSREVEINNIQMTATAPVTVQMSMGMNMYNAMTSDSAQLTAISSGNGVGLVQAPANTDASQDWGNKVAFTDFYTAPTLTPASSTNGASVWVTSDMTGVGQTVATSGTASAATAGTLALTATRGVTTPTDTADVHYVDFPVWFRTSKSDADVTLSVKATTYQGDNDSAKAHAENDGTAALYKSARVSVLKWDATANSNAGGFTDSDGVIIPYDGDTPQYVDKYYAHTGTGSTASDGKALTAAGSFTSTGAIDSRAGDAYGNVDAVAQTGATTPDTIITIPKKGGSAHYTGNSSTGSTGDNTMYGPAECVIVRVWLEGEDSDCWNQNEGQDFKITLNFEEITSA
jgi:hypothetical protein